MLCCSHIVIYKVIDTHPHTHTKRSTHMFQTETEIWKYVVIFIRCWWFCLISKVLCLHVSDLCCWDLIFICHTIPVVGIILCKLSTDSQWCAIALYDMPSRGQHDAAERNTYEYSHQKRAILSAYPCKFSL